MAVYPSREEKLKYIRNYIQSGEKKRSDREMGVELEHLVIDQKTKKRRFYYEERGVRELLQRISALEGLEGIYKQNELLGVQGPDYEISIEPGAQFEISLSKQEKISDLYRIYRGALDSVFPILKELDAGLLTLGMDPVNAVEDIPLIPKRRYEIMNEYLGQRGSLTRYMMRLTCALQISIDFSDEEDFRKKYRLATALTPILYTLFDNSPLLEGRPIDHFNMRQKIWKNTDPDRCGLVPSAFEPDFGYEAYARWILDNPVLFIPQLDGSVKDLGAMTCEQALDLAETEEEARAIVEHALSIVFPDVRVKRYIEIRPMDEVPEQYAFAAAALIKGIFYHQPSLDRLAEYFSEGSLEMVERGKNSGNDNGIQGFYFSHYFAHWGLILIDLAEQGLDDEERVFLQPLKELWDNLDTPRSVFERLEEEGGRQLALEAFQVSDRPRIHLSK